MVYLLILLYGKTLNFFSLLSRLSHLKDCKLFHVSKAEVLYHCITVYSRWLLEVAQYLRELHGVSGEQEEEYPKDDH